MLKINAHQAVVAPDIVLDGRLALYHQEQRWLAVADLHFGFEISQRAAGRLMPVWGMSSVETQLLQLVADYQPRHLIILGDVVHDGAAIGAARQLFARLSALCELVLIAGNHDRHLLGRVEMLLSWQSDGFHFHHGHCATDVTDRIQVIGHHHPSGSVTDGAGLRLKLPAFVQQGGCWILPAFSPWAAGTRWEADEHSRIWLCAPQRVLAVPQLAAPPVP